MSLDAIGIVSKNMNESARFYKLLDVELKQSGGPDHMEGDTPSGVRLMLDSVKLMKELQPDWQEPSGAGVTLCFKQSDAQTVDTVFSKIEDAGFQSVKEPWDAFWGQRYASVKDPDGNPIDIFADLAERS